MSKMLADSDFSIEELAQLPQLEFFLGIFDAFPALACR
jgi:hypothetical protein